MTSPPTVSVWWGEHEMCRLFVFMLAPVALRFDQASEVSGFSTFDAYGRTDDGQAEFAFSVFFSAMNRDREREGGSGREPTSLHTIVRSPNIKERGSVKMQLLIIIIALFF